jgi:hypothetical protein
MVSILKSQSDLISSKILLRNNSKLAKDILKRKLLKDCIKKTIIRWQVILSIFFYFDIVLIKRDSNSLSDFLTRKFVQGRQQPKTT